MVYDEGDQLRSDQEERRREKFSRERGGDFSMDRGRRNFGGLDRRDYSNGFGGAKKRSFRDEDGFQAKRSRFDAAADSYEPQFNRRNDGINYLNDTTSSQPQLLTFRKFLNTQDDAILTDEEAFAKYNEYKTEFMRQECEHYFQSHKNDEWFVHLFIYINYHPLVCEERLAERRLHVQKRLQVFNELDAVGKIDELTLSYEYAEELIRFMNIVVIKLEDGTDADIEIAKNEPINDESVLDLLSDAKFKLQKQTQTDDNLQNSTDHNITSSANKCSIQSAIDGDASDDQKIEDVEENVEGKPIELNPIIQQTKQTPLPYKTCSIHFRTVPVTVTLTEIENLCKQHPGFLRLSLTDPMPVVIDTRFGKPQLMRTALVTYREDVNIKEIFWSMRTVKFDGVSLSASVNRELRRRVRSIGPTSGLASHRYIVQNDIRQAAKLILLYDLKEGLYRQEIETSEEGEEQMQNELQPIDDEIFSDLEGTVLKSKNPILSRISDYLVYETSAEEDALTESAAHLHGTELMEEIEKDNNLIKVLDRLILYLRIVHSIDFYAAIDYLKEDEMPHRFALIHVRDRPLENISVNAKTLLPKNIITGHIATFNSLLEQGLFKRALLPEEELQKLGKKDAEKAVQEFLDKNTVEQAPGKYLCPLSGKRFRAVEFVHKHLYSKHQEEIDAARHEALYFNNYLCDPNRPHNQIFAKIINTASEFERELRRSSISPSRRNTQSSTMEESSGGGKDLERTTSRNTWQPLDRFSTSGVGGNKYNGGGGQQRSFISGPQTRQRFSYEPVNEVSGGAGGGYGSGGCPRTDPRAPPSYRDLDAPTEDIM
ncbi:hypothetical protein Mgra_00007491 [Meloidogyne graminicola]|uniref:Serrate RNA effector molecule homolog n=1 Tax=Meloidogyne graminicola TaxID=189291 RepID=A0A8S9ZIH2_9BILA|nr:hypothetical protein Mgra_00007491 [Meloidogyne graminicola]